MVIPALSVTYTHQAKLEKCTLEVGTEFVDWQGDTVGKVKYLQIFTGTGVRVQLEEGPEHWIHWGRIIEWSADK